ncbi:MAG: tetratricopeptide repeat protein [Acidobacteriota bacterium]
MAADSAERQEVSLEKPASNVEEGTKAFITEPDTKPVEVDTNLSLGDQGTFANPTLPLIQPETSSPPRPLQTLPRSISPPHRFPVANWDRYEFIDFIGEGGMGRVYKARDHRLRRYVALKFIRGNDAKLIRRFMQEAQSQARIDHEHICKVYEVGEVETRPYIAMQYIEGQSLEQARNRLTLTEKVKVMKEVAEALQAAHRLGLIHRDVKPANIMVQKDESGNWRPYVMDFGLAREVEAEGMTVAGTIMGTPSYMAPEQALQAFGEKSQLDRRTDVYGLGATLYGLLVGRPPFQGGAPVELLMQVMQVEPYSLRKLDSQIPIELEAIVLKCLEKEPARRYDSAKALADDLQRFLDGEPVQARPVTWAYRVSKKARKQRTLLITLAVALAIVTVLGVMWLQARWTAAEQAQLAQQFGQEFGQRVKEIETIMRVASLLPLHDTQREKAVIRTRMQSIEARMNLMGQSSKGPGNYALGRGYLTLHEYERAHHHLMQAWEIDYRTPEVKYALGQVMGNLYLKGLEEAQRSSSKEARAMRVKEAESNYRKPALEYLKSSVGIQVESPAYIEGLIAFYEKRYDEALQKAEQAFQQIPWLYEAKKLAGDVHLVIGIEKQDKGDNEGALADYEQAGKAYSEAIAIGESDATVYEGEGTRWIQVMKMEIARGNDGKPAFERALAICDKALQANSQSSEAYFKKAKAYFHWAENQAQRGEDPRQLLERSVEMAEQAIHWNSLDVNAYSAVSLSYWRRSEYEFGHGLDPRPSLEQAIEILKKAIEINPNFAYTYVGMGNAYITKIQYEQSKGLDAKDSIERAIDNLQRAVSLNSNLNSAVANLGATYVLKAGYQSSHGIDPRTSLDQAVKFYQQSIQINPNHSSSYGNLGLTYKDRASYEMEHGGDPLPWLAQAIESFQKAIQLNPKNPYSYGNLGSAYGTRAIYERAHGQDPRPTLAQALESYQQAQEINPNAAIPLLNAGFDNLMKGEYELELGLDPNESLNTARAALKKALQIDPEYASGYLHLGDAEILAARWAKRRNQPTKPFLEKADGLIKKSLQINAESIESLVSLATVRRWQAEWDSNHQSAEKAVEDGLNITKQALSIDPNYARIIAIQGTLNFIKSRLVQETATQQEVLQAAQASLELALQQNPLLQKDYRPILLQVQQSLTERKGN